VSETQQSADKIMTPSKGGTLDQLAEYLAKG
jgi:hypothetical protein